MTGGGPSWVGRVPSPVAVIAAGRRVRLAWTNELGGLTFEVGVGPERCFVKWTPRTSGIDLTAEAVRLTWASAFSPVPQVLAQGSDNTGAWIVTAALPGENAVSNRWRADPGRAVRAIGEGLRALHEALPVESCPFSWSAAERVEDAHRRAAAGRIDPAVWHEEHQPLTVRRALHVLADAPPVDQLVVCHGDACSPNTLIDDDGGWSGHVDLGTLGVADRWADLAIATWSTEWNYGAGWAGHLLAAYGIEPDPSRTAYYRLLWDLDP